jgi:hypothetical protein
VKFRQSLYPQQPLFVRLVKGSSIILDEKHSFYRGHRFCEDNAKELNLNVSIDELELF